MSSITTISVLSVQATLNAAFAVVLRENPS
jgi:hypothetical protein